MKSPLNLWFKEKQEHENIKNWKTLFAENWILDLKLIYNITNCLYILIYKYNQICVQKRNYFGFGHTNLVTHLSPNCNSKRIFFCVGLCCRRINSERNWRDFIFRSKVAPMRHVLVPLLTTSMGLVMKRILFNGNKFLTTS